MKTSIGMFSILLFLGLICLQKLMVQNVDQNTKQEKLCVNMIHFFDNTQPKLFSHICPNMTSPKQVIWFWSCNSVTNSGMHNETKVFKSMHNGEPSVVTWNYKNIRSLRVVILSQTINTKLITVKQEFPLSYLVQPLARIKYIEI